MSIKLGRNDPCHCGSGKKYKKCHLAIDEQNRPRITEPADDFAAPELPPTLAKLPPGGQVTALLKQLENVGSAKDRAQWRQFLAENQETISYLQMQDQIEAAGEVLEAHRATFEKLIENPRAYMDRAQELFAEERFAPLRFTGAEVSQALQNRGLSVSPVSPDAEVERIRDAILKLATKERRTQMALQLLSHLPELVKAERYLDAWVVQHCSLLTAEVLDESNAFLYQMFSFGYDAWQAEMRRGDEIIIREMGLDPERLQTMSIEEIEAWLQEQQSDPAKQARLEALMQANPEQQKQAIANLQQMERESIELMEGKDAHLFLLTPADLEPCIPAIEEFWESTLAKFPQANAQVPPNEETSKALAKAVWELSGQIAETVFTPERIQQLIAKLQKYRNEQLTAGQKRIATIASAVITSLEKETEPGLNYFLTSLCFASLRQFTSSIVDAKRESEGPDTGASAEPER